MQRKKTSYLKNEMEKDKSCIQLTVERTLKSSQENEGRKGGKGSEFSVRLSGSVPRDWSSTTGRGGQKRPKGRPPHVRRPKKIPLRTCLKTFPFDICIANVAGHTKSTRPPTGEVVCRNDCGGHQQATVRIPRVAASGINRGTN